MTERAEGRILRSLSGFYDVQTADGLVTCRARGILRKEGNSPLTGDLVEITVERGKVMVEKILPRKNKFIRPAVANIDAAIDSMELYATAYGYPNVKAYMKGMYGNGTTEESLRNYYEMTELARYYQNEYQESLTYSDADLRAAEAENYGKYSSFNYNYYYLNAFNFVESESENAAEYTAEQKAEGARLAEEAAKTLTTGITTVEEFDAAIAALPINAENTSAASYVSTDVPYNSIFAGYAEWVADESRKAGDMTYAANTTTDEEGNETINGYYVVMFGSRNDNTFALANVRHILVSFEGGTYNSTTGMTDYSEAEMAEAKLEAETLLNEFKAGKATSMDFADMANKHSADGDGTTGGLYEDVVPGQMTASFDAWCFEEGRKAGDTGLVESEYGWHIMYYEGDSETTYREYLIDNALRGADVDAWYTALLEAVKVTEGNTDHMDKALVLSKG